jgi:hypothetical protein
LIAKGADVNKMMTKVVSDINGTPTITNGLSPSPLYLAIPTNMSYQVGTEAIAARKDLIEILLCNGALPNLKCLSTSDPKEKPTMIASKPYKIRTMETPAQRCQSLLLDDSFPYNMRELLNRIINAKVDMRITPQIKIEDPIPEKREAICRMM